jgi:hypothetical protein
LFLTLALLKPWVLFVDHIQLAFSANDLAVNATLFDGCSYFHFILLLLLTANSQRLIAKLFVPENDPSPGQIVWTHFNPNLITRQNADIVHSHFPRDGGQYFVPVFQFYAEHGV